ncbi:LiaI-LiaF-like domain-containing protein [Bacillus sp. FSL K6-3431]|uniref:LiaI-LiaF-like domain-containing protein n=1 Tax=Bacillus sp. FSL K6-3431 TaxID=2921500 RepID=UPI0030F4C3B1
MKKQALFAGIILFGFGTYFLLQQYHFTLISGLYTWPTLLIIIGIGFLVQAYAGKSYDAIIPGIVLTGIGLHFHITNKLAVWPDHTGIFLLVIALGLLLKYIKTGTSLIQGILFLLAAIFILFFDRLINWAVTNGYNITVISKIWPFFFIAAGAYFLFFSKKQR